MEKYKLWFQRFISLSFAVMTEKRPKIKDNVEAQKGHFNVWHFFLLDNNLLHMTRQETYPNMLTVWAQFMLVQLVTSRNICFTLSFCSEMALKVFVSYVKITHTKFITLFSLPCCPNYCIGKYQNGTDSFVSYQLTILLFDKIWIQLLWLKFDADWNLLPGCNIWRSTLFLCNFDVRHVIACLFL